MKKPKLLLLVFMIIYPISMWSQTWLGAISSDWNTPGNWSTSAVPTSTETATFDAGAINCTISGNITVGGINITNGYSGTITIADGGTFTVENQNYIQTGGTFNCGNGAFVCSNNTFFNEDGGTFISSSGTITLGGQVDFFSGGFNANGGTIIFNSQSATTNITVDGNNVAEVVLNNVIINIPTPAAPTNSYLLGSNSTLLIQGDLTITRGSFNGTVPGHVKLLGNFMMNQTGTAGNLASNVDIEFIGNINTTITLSTGGETLYNGGIFLSKTSAANTVTLNSPMIMNNQTNSELNFISGKLVTTTANILTIDINGITISGGSDNSFVDGPMIKNNVRGTANAGFIFPIGDNGRYAPLAISGADNSISNFGMAAGHSLQAEYFHSDPDPDFSVNSKDVSLANIGRCEYWVLDRLADPGANADPFVWLSYDNTRSCGIGTPADLRVAKWNGTMWNDLGNALTTIGGISFISTAAIVSTFSPFNLASTSPITNPLPVTLVNFKAYQQQIFVHLEWNTASENNSDHFTVQRSVDGIRFDSLATIPAANSSISILNYKYDDYTAASGLSYYRLKITDKDGKFVYSKVISIDASRKSGPIWVFPNPIKPGEKISLLIPEFKNKIAKVSLADITGRNISMNNAMFDSNGRAILAMNQYLLSGIYIIEVYMEDRQYTVRVSIVNK